jgi:hypothetical protein
MAQQANQAVNEQVAQLVGAITQLMALGLTFGMVRTLAPATSSPLSLLPRIARGVSSSHPKYFEVIPDDELTPKQRIHLKLARAIADRLFQIDKIRGVHAAHIYMRAAAGRKKALGLYDRNNWEVYLAPEALDRAFLTVAMLVHELGHHVSNAEDLTEEHAYGMQEVGARLMQYTSQGVFDSELREVEW